METTHPRRWLWLSRVFGWDGVLPLLVVLLPFVVGAIVPNAEKAIILLSLTLPIAALFVRYYIGRRTIASNKVGRIFGICQRIVFTVSILWLLFLEFFVIVLHLVPAVPVEDLCLIGVMYSLYLAGMTFAMFPGRGEPPPAQGPNAHGDSDFGDAIG